MTKASIFYNSRTGITKRYAQEIGKYLESKNLVVGISSIQKYSPELLDGVNYIFLGCWTNGLMVIFQHPDKPWLDFAAGLPELPNANVALFTTYKFLTGSMFSNMSKHLNGKLLKPVLELKSRNGYLSDDDKIALDAFIG